MRQRRLAGVLIAVLVLSILGAGCGSVPTTGGIQGYVVKNAYATSLTGAGSEEKIGVLAAVPKSSEYVVLADARVQATGLDYPYQIAETRSASDGRFVITGLRPGRYQVTVTHENFLFLDIYQTQCTVQAGKLTWIGEAQLGSLHILSIGISRYSNPEHDLNYAADDAALIAQVLGGQSNRLAKQTKTLCDSSATRTGILNAIISMGAEMSEGDTFIMFFSGHGLQTSTNEYIVPHDYDGTLRSLIADMELNDAVDRCIPASNKIFIFDSCHSAGMYKSLTQSLSPGFRRSTGFEIMARNIVGPGKIVIAACNKNEASWESSEYGHGLFTQYFVWGMTGPWYYADSNRDSFIDTDEAFWYAGEHVKEITKDWVYPRAPQNPQIYRGPINSEGFWRIFSY
ncbi:MAG TPA: caspase family protein [Bacillota bacterium]|nr:caspase family protein [Bacillota bacterium]